VKLHEFQAKSLLARFGVPVPRGEAASTAEEARLAAARLGGRVVVKAQIHAGGRGKGTFQEAGTGRPLLAPGGKGVLRGVVVVEGADAACEIARLMLGNVLVTAQTGPAGRAVRRVLVEEATEIGRELYLAILLDRSAEAVSFVACAEGGMDIEELARSRPEAILKVPVDPRGGYTAWIGRKLCFGVGLGPSRLAEVVALGGSLHRALTDLDASLIEINPLVETADGRLLALDAKILLDDSALYRHEDLRGLRDPGEEDPLEVEASRFGIHYVKLEGDVGCMVNGAGLAMATMDLIQHHGGRPANFLDVGGGATAEMVRAAFEILLRDRNVKAILVNIFGGIMRCDVVAEGILAAARAVRPAVPVVVRLEGTNVERGRDLLRSSGLAFEVAEGMDEAARKVIAAAASR